MNQHPGAEVPRSAVTLDDVARAAGVSSATASRAINGRAGVRAEVRERVVEVAGSLGYRANRAAQNLASGRSSIIGLVLPSRHLSVDPYGASLIQAVSRSANELDQGLMLLLGSEEPGGTVRHILRDGIIDGVLISSVALGDPWVDELLDSPIPSVVVGSRPDRDDVHAVDAENRGPAAEAVSHLAELGRRRIATVTGPLTRRDATDRLAGYHDAMAAHGLTVDDSMIATGDFTRRAGLAAGDRLFGGERRPDAVFAANDEMALGVVAAAARRGLDVPRDVAVVGFDGTATSDDELLVGLPGIRTTDDEDHPWLTSVHQPFPALGRAAVDSLLDILAGTAVERVRTVEPTLVIGWSSGADLS